MPDAVKGEFVNLGVVLLEEGDNGFTDVRFLRDWRRLRGLDPEADIELLERYEAELRRLLQSHEREVINYREPMSRREWLLAQMQQSFSGALEITPMTAVLTESPQAEIGKLAQTRKQRGLGFKIEIDGGVSAVNTAEIVRAGCDWLVSGSAVFHSADPVAAVKEMQQIAENATAIRV